MMFDANVPAPMVVGVLLAGAAGAARAMLARATVRTPQPVRVETARRRRPGRRRAR